MRRLAVSYRFDDVILNPEAFSVEKAGHVLTLEPKSIRLLLYLIQNPSRAVGKEELFQSVWEGVAVTDNALAHVVAQLRKALGDDAKVARYIETVPTIGYRFIAQVEEVLPRAPRDPAAPEAPRRKSPWFLRVALAVALLGALVGLDVMVRTGPGAPASWSGMVLGGSIIASHARISPDGQLLAFRAIINGQSQVAVMKPDSSSWTALTQDRSNGAVASVAWSRDGRKIFFDREWGPGRIYAIGALGGEPRLVLENAWIPEPLPDGSLIALRHTPQGREQLLHFWPETGRTQMLPATVRYTDVPNVRAFPDGREVAIFGLPEGGAGPPRLFVLNLKSLQIRDPGTGEFRAGTLSAPIAISPDGRSVLVQRHRNDTVDTIALPRSGSTGPQTLISLPGLASPISLDAATDGSIYMDHSEFERSVLNLNSSGVVESEIPIPELAEGGGMRAAIALSGGAVVFDVQRRGRSELFIGRPGAEPRLLLNAPEPASLPGALLGTDKIAFILGAAGAAHIAVASLHDGTVMRRFGTDARQVTALTAPADGQTIYYASGGAIWAHPASGGDPRKIGEGHDVAVEPSGKYLYLRRAGPDGYELFRMPAAGGEATRIVVPGELNMTPLPLSPSAVDRNGRLLLPVELLDVFFYQAAIFDPAKGTMKPLAVPPRMVVVSSGWTPDGGIAARITRWYSSLWRYRISL